jgi:hypothetical protein
MSLIPGERGGRGQGNRGMIIAELFNSAIIFPETEIDEMIAQPMVANRRPGS